jgi:transposase InsO family protein
VEDLVIGLRKERPRRGARKIRAVLQRRVCPAVPAVSTVHQILVRNGLVRVQRRRRSRAWKRFERPVPNDLWQIDATEVRLADNSKAWVIDVIDDHARFAIAGHACRSATTTAAWRAIEQAIAEHGPPRQLISDNGLSFTGNRHNRTVHFERQLKALGVQQLTAKPRHPQICGELERYHRTFKQYYADHGPADSIQPCNSCCTPSAGTTTSNAPHQSLAYATPQDTYTKTAPRPHRPRLGARRGCARSPPETGTADTGRRCPPSRGRTTAPTRPDGERACAAARRGYRRRRAGR